MAHRRGLEPGYDLEQNFQRALLFLDISVQQIRLVDSATANRIDRYYIQKIRAEFEEFFQSDFHRNLAHVGASLQIAGDQLYENIIQQNEPKTKTVPVAGPASRYPLEDSFARIPKSNDGSSANSRSFHTASEAGSRFGLSQTSYSPDQDRVKHIAGPSNLTGSFAQHLPATSVPIDTMREQNLAMPGRLASDNRLEGQHPIPYDTVSAKPTLDAKRAHEALLDKYVGSFARSPIAMYRQPTKTSAASQPAKTHNVFAPPEKELVADHFEDTAKTARPGQAEVVPPAASDRREIDDEDLKAYLQSRGWNISKKAASASPSAAMVPLAAAVAPATPGTTPSMNWAKIAAIRGNKGSADAAFGNLRPPPAPRVPTGGQQHSGIDGGANSGDELLPARSIAERGTRESYPQTLRVVWIYNLPPVYELAQLSAKISEGALMSLSLLQDIAAHLPGKSACLVFQHAMDAANFIQNNGCEITLFAADEAAKAEMVQGEGYQDNRPAPLVEQSAHHPNRFVQAKDALHAVIALGGAYPYQASPFLALMDTHRARRRLKWARKGLFQSVPIGTFKRDVLKLAGGPSKIELMHFFNAGECTVVFDSIQTAVVVLMAFDAWSHGKKTPPEIIAMMSHKTSPTAAARQLTLPKPSGGIGKGGKGGIAPRKAAEPASKATKFPMGKYEGVVVDYCKDFNEDACSALVSTYVAAGAPEAVVAGIKGIFQGPKIPVETL